MENVENVKNIEHYLQSLSGQEFERVCGQLMSALGFQIEYTKASGDGGIDILAYNSAPLLKGKYIVQCKRYSGNVGQPIIRDLYGVVAAEQATKGILITTGGFAAPAKDFASKLPIELIDGTMLINLLLKNNIEIITSKPIDNPDEITTILSRLLEEECYIRHKNKCIRENYSISSVGALANYLFINALTPDYGTGLSPCLSERMILLEEVHRLLNSLISRIPRKVDNKNDTVKLYICRLILAQVCFLLGDFQQSKALYHRILGWRELTDSLDTCNGLADMFFDVSIDMCSFYSCIGEKSLAAQWLTHPAISKLL